MISAEKIKDLARIDSLKVKIYDSIDSTNAEAKRYASEAGEDLSPVLFIALEQSAGRGRMGRSFLSRANKGVFMSLLYFSKEPLADAVSVTTAAAVAVALSVENVSGIKTRIKWVNDIYDDCGKICGILAETQSVGEGYAIIVGIGINVGKSDFPEELRGIASSVSELKGREDEIIADITARLIKHSAMPTDRSYMKAYRDRFMLLNAEVDLYINGEITESGRVVGVDDDGGLLFQPDGLAEIKSIHSGEVTVRKRG